MEMEFGIKGSCADCPFSAKGPPTHWGVVDSIPEYIRHAKNGMLSHSCHKTDARADRPETYKGPTLHCGGLLGMFAKGATATPAAIGCQTDVHEYRDFESFDSIGDLVKHYAESMWTRLLMIFDNPRVYVDDESYITDDPTRVWYLDSAGKDLVRCGECGCAASHRDPLHPYCFGHELCEVCRMGSDNIELMIDLLAEYTPSLIEKHPRWRS